MQTFISNQIPRLMLLLLGSINGCQWLSTQVEKTVQSAGRSHSQFDIEARPPVELKSYIPSQYDYQVESKIKTRDKHGHLRIQLVIRTAQQAQEDFFWQIIDQYRSQFQVIWIKLCPQESGDCFSLKKAQQAAWFDPELTPSQRHTGFDFVKSKQGLYLNQ